jgi:hypothetical protein
VRFSLDRRWATLVVAVALGAGGGSVLGFLTTPAGPVDASPSLAPPQAVAPSTTRRQRSRFAGISSTTTRPPRPRAPAATAGRIPATTSTTTSTVRPTTTTTLLPTTSTTEPATTTTTEGGTTSSSSGSSLPTSTTQSPG